MEEDDDAMVEEDEDSNDHDLNATDLESGDDSDDNRTLSSINETISIKTRSRVTDFALTLWVENNHVNPHKDDEEEEVFIIEKEFITALIEIKRAASRKLMGENLVAAQRSLMYHAQEAVFRQVMYLQPKSFDHSLIPNRRCICLQIANGLTRKMFLSLQPRGIYGPTR